MPLCVQYFPTISGISASARAAEEVLGDLSLTLTIGPFSSMTLSDDDPKSWFDFFSLLGGAWSEYPGFGGLHVRGDEVHRRYVMVHSCK